MNSKIPERDADFDPLDMRNYSLEKLKEIKSGPLMKKFKLVGVPLALFSFLFFHLHLGVTIQLFESQSEVKPQVLYSVLGIFVGSLILWLSEAIPNYLTSLIIIVSAILTGTIKMNPAFALFGQPVMILNIASFIMASALVVTGLAKRVSLMLVLKTKNHLTALFLAFVSLNLIFGAFISATSAKTALLLPLFMVISAIYGAYGGASRNSVGKNLVLLNLLANNVSASAFMTGSAANLLAVAMLERAGADVSYQQWFIALAPFAVVQCLFAWWTGVKVIFPISKEEATPKTEGGMTKLQEEYEKLGKIKSSEIRAGIVFMLVLGLWSTGNIHGIPEEVVALIGAIAVLIPGFSKLPALGVMSWNDVDIPWHMLLFSFGAYVLGAIMDESNIIGIFIDKIFDTWQIHPEGLGKLLVFAVLSGIFAITTIISESKTARTIIMFPIFISIAKRYGWDLIGFCLPFTFMINQVYVLYFNSKPANISYLTDQYSMGDSAKYGMFNLVSIWILLILWTQYVMPIMGFDSSLW